MTKEAIAHFLSQNPSLSEILDFVEQQAQRIAKKRMGAGGGTPAISETHTKTTASLERDCHYVVRS